MDEVMKNINPDTYPSFKDAEAAAKKFKKKWLKTPQKELDGNTPIDVILNEREMLGNPNKKFGIHLEITGVQDYDMNLADKLYWDGIEAFNEGSIEIAKNYFEQVTKMYPENYKAWGNLGSALSYLGAKQDSIKCYKTALSINPNYGFARKNIKIAKDTPEDVLAMQGFLGAMRGTMHYGIGKHGKKSKEKINVWKDMDKFLKETQEKAEE